MLKPVALGNPENSFAALALVEGLIRSLIAKGVMTENEVSTMFHEVGDMLGKQPIANAQRAGAAISKAGGAT